MCLGLVIRICIIPNIHINTHKIGVLLCILGIIHIHKTRPKPQTKIMENITPTDIFHFTTLLLILMHSLILNRNYVFSLWLSTNIFSSCYNMVNQSRDINWKVKDTSIFINDNVSKEKTHRQPSYFVNIPWCSWWIQQFVFDA